MFWLLLFSHTTFKQRVILIMKFLERINTYLDIADELRATRTKNKIKTKPENFIVEEIMLNGKVLEFNKPYNEPDSGETYSIFVLQKKCWDTTLALKLIGTKLGKGIKCFSFAGTKDKHAITTQLASCYGDVKEKLLNLKLKDIIINGCWMANNPVKLGDLLGNRFIISLSDCINPKTHQLFSQAGVFPNFFGIQRFGYRVNNHIIGKYIIQSKLQKAVFEFLCGNAIDKNEEAKKARELLKTEGDFARALKYFPKCLKHERRVIAHLVTNERDYANALRKLPRQLLLMFVHSYQSYLFNKMLKKRISLEDEFSLITGEYLCERNAGFPLIENKTNSNDGVPVGKKSIDFQC